jgi:hypothetical protein
MKEKTKMYKKSSQEVKSLSTEEKDDSGRMRIHIIYPEKTHLNMNPYDTKEKQPKPKEHEAQPN